MDKESGVRNKYSAIAAFVLILAGCRTAFASAGESLPWGDFLLRTINAAVFIGIIWYAAGKLIKKFFVDRRAGIVQEMEELTRRHKEAENRLAEVESQIAGVESECAALLEEGRAQAEHMKSVILADAEKQAARIVEQARRNAEQEGKAELESIRNRMAEAIVSAVEQSLTEKLDAKMHQKLLDKSLTKVVLQ